jgi:predicted metal-dependent hydrolase
VERQLLSDDEWKEYIRALELFNSKYFWECHECLEEIWLHKSPPLKTFLQGIIQAAAAFYHVLNENPRGVLKLSQDAINKLAPLESPYLGLNTQALNAALENFRLQAERISQGQETSFCLEQIPLLALPKEKVL